VSRLTELGWTPRVTLREGIERSVAWYRRDVKRASAQEAVR
jgi:nucleoside-diphosphate-sugar epimerase